VIQGVENSGAYGTSFDNLAVSFADFVLGIIWTRIAERFGFFAGHEDIL
jgi:hypothetical protein